MPIIIATGSNLGDRLKNLRHSQELLEEHFKLEAHSQVYRSQAVEYFDQPDFYNQVLQFQTPTKTSPQEAMKLLLMLEIEMGRERNIPKGPRIIDLDLLFFDLKELQSDLLELPHPRLFERSFVVHPLRELPYFYQLKKHYDFPRQFSVEAYPLR